jgi:hypothetical protein
MYVCLSQTKKANLRANFFFWHNILNLNKFSKRTHLWQRESLHLGVSTRSYCGGNRFVANENVFPAPNHTSLCFVVFLSLLLLQLSTVDSAAPILQHFVTRFSIKGLFKSAWCICSGSERSLCSLCFLFHVSDQQR